MKTKWLPLSENYYTGSTTLLLQDTTNQSKKGYLCITAFSGYTDRLMFINNIFRWPSSPVRHRNLVFFVFLFWKHERFRGIQVSHALTQMFPFRLLNGPEKKTKKNKFKLSLTRRWILYINNDSINTSIKMFHFFI